MSGLFCFGCNYPGEEHNEQCPEYVDVERLVAQRDRFREQIGWLQNRADTLYEDAGRRHVENLTLTADRDQWRARAEDSQQQASAWADAAKGFRERAEAAEAERDEVRGRLGAVAAGLSDRLAASEVEVERLGKEVYASDCVVRKVATEVIDLRAENERLRALLAQARLNHCPRLDDNKPHPVHPGYGPCDAFVVGGGCSECVAILERLKARVAELEAQYETCFKERQEAELKLQCVVKLNAATVASVEAQPERYVGFDSDGRTYIFPINQWSMAAGEVRGAADERAAICAFLRDDSEHGGESCSCVLMKADAIEQGAHRKGEP